mgnify:FL=1
MNSSKINSEWTNHAIRIIDDFERGAIEELRVIDLAKQVGVSRQTIWLDKELMSRLKSVIEASSEKGIKPKRANSKIRIRILEQEIAKLKNENANLIQNFLNVCRRLHERGMDAHVFMADAVDNEELLKDQIIEIDGD